MGNNTPQLNRNLTQGTQLPSHITPTTGVPTMSLHTPPSPSRCVRRSSLVLWVSLNMCGLLWFVTHGNRNGENSESTKWELMMFQQGDITDEHEEHAESLSGRSRHWNERQDQQYGQLGAGQPQPQLAQYHLYAQTATSTPALHHQQVHRHTCSPVWHTFVQMCCFVSCAVLKIEVSFFGFFYFYICSMSGFGMNRNQAFGMNNSLSSNIFNGTGWCGDPGGHTN